MAGVQLDWVISHLCLVAQQRKGAGGLYETLSHRSFSRVNRLRVDIEFSALIGWIAVYVRFRRLVFGDQMWTEMLEQQSLVNYHTVAGWICWELLYCWSESCNWLGQNSPDLFSFHLNLQRVSLIRIGFRSFLKLKLPVYMRKINLQVWIFKF